MNGPRLVAPHDHCPECRPVALSIEAHQLYPVDPEARAHEMSAACWCEPTVQVVHRNPARTDVPALREAGAL